MNPFVQYSTADYALKCITQILMEEELEDKTFIPRDSALQSAEKSLSDILAENSSTSTSIETPIQNLENHVSTCCNINGGISSVTPDNIVSSSLIGGLNNLYSSCVIASPVNYSFPYSLQSCPLSPYPLGSFLGTPDGLLNSSNVNTDHCECQSNAQFKRGVEETWEFHRKGNEVILDFASNRTIPVEVTVTKKNKRDSTACQQKKRNCQQKKRKKHCKDENELEMRIKKNVAVYTESEKLEKFDKVVPSITKSDETALFYPDEAFQKGTGRILHQKRQLGRFKSETTLRETGVNSWELVDTRTLLIHCAEAVAGNDDRSAAEVLMQIRQHSTPFGDGSQRLAYCFTKALEARMTGTGSDLYATLAAKMVPDSPVIEASRLILSACPFLNMSNLFASHAIMDLSKKAASIHIIHFGILYGFPWPSLIQHLSTRAGGPPVLLRVTGIELPQTHFGSSEMLDGTGRHLASYCQKFNVPFKYNIISKEWENIRFEDLKIDRNEVIAVCSLYQFRLLLDETVALNSQKDAVLNLIKRINPDVFIHGIINAAYDAPFFMSRFREALFYFSSLFDMLDANTHREDPDRMVFEQDVFGKEILNVIACEGLERVERPEKYKQWKVRNERAGLRKMPLRDEVVQKVKEQVKKHYHQDFLVDEEGEWMLQGWKGRILFAISCWN